MEVFNSEESDFKKNNALFTKFQKFPSTFPWEDKKYHLNVIGKLHFFLLDIFFFIACVGMWKCIMTFPPIRCLHLCIYRENNKKLHLMNFYLNVIRGKEETKMSNDLLWNLLDDHDDLSSFWLYRDDCHFIYTISIFCLNDFTQEFLVLLF